jgi:hypothetical protein
MRSRRTTLSYSAIKGLFTVSAEIPGMREPLRREVPTSEIDRIGDMDVTNAAQRAMFFPGREIVVTRPRLAAI